MYWLNPTYWFANEYQKKKAKILHTTRGKTSIGIELNKLDYEYNLKSRKQYEYDRLELIYPDVQSKDYKFDKLTLDLKFDVITQAEFDLKQAGLMLDYGEMSNYEYQVYLVSWEKTYKGLSDDESRHRMLDIEYSHGNITEEEYEAEKIELMEDSEDKKFLTYEHLHKFGHITEKEFQKHKATYNKEQWVDVEIVRHGEGINDFSIEVDWNEYFIDFLRDNDYNGQTDEEIIEFWVGDLGRTISEEQEIAPFNPETIIKRHKGDDGITTYT